MPSFSVNQYIRTSFCLAMLFSTTISSIEVGLLMFVYICSRILLYNHLISTWSLSCYYRHLSLFRVEEIKTNGWATYSFNTGEGLTTDHFFICHFYGFSSDLNDLLEPWQNQASGFIYRFQHDSFVSDTFMSLWELRPAAPPSSSAQQLRPAAPPSCSDRKSVV